MSSHPLIRRAPAAALLAACALGVAAAPSAAELLTYVDGTPRDVWVENADGSLRRQLTTDAADKLNYSFPSANDAGDVAALLIDGTTGNPAIVVIRADGSRTVNLMPAWGTGVTVPFGARLQPEGRLLAYTFGRFHGGGSSVAGNVVPADAPGSPTGPGPGFPGMTSATWWGGKLVWSNGTDVFYGSGAETTAWQEELTFAEVSRDATRLLGVASTATGNLLVYHALKGPMPSQLDYEVGGCLVPHSGELTDAALAPNGRQVAWKDSAGLHVADAAITQAGGACALTGERLVSATAEDPAFSNATLTTPPPPPPPDGGDRSGGGGGGGGGGTPTGGGGDRSGGGSSGGGSGARAKVTVVATTLTAAVKKGLKVKLTGLPKGRVTVTAKFGRRAIGSTRAKVPASGRATVTVRFTKAGRKTLKGRRAVSIAVLAGRARTTVRLRAAKGGAL